MNAYPLLNREIKWMRSLFEMSKIFSTCAKRHYAAVVISPEGRVVGFGYNGSPPGYGHCVDGACPRYLQNSPSGSTYDNCIAQHAEANALLWSDPGLRNGSTLIVNGPPCFGCAKAIASSGVKRVVHFTDRSYLQWPEVKSFLETCGVSVVPVEPASIDSEGVR